MDNQVSSFLCLMFHSSWHWQACPHSTIMRILHVGKNGPLFIAFVPFKDQMGSDFNCQGCSRCLPLTLNQPIPNWQDFCRTWHLLVAWFPSSVLPSEVISQRKFMRGYREQIFESQIPNQGLHQNMITPVGDFQHSVSSLVRKMNFQLSAQ